jgi:5-formyltetrahydrofolate cyclo-ligase
VSASLDKEDLRQRMRARRRGIDPRARARRAALLAEAVRANPAYAGAACVMAFVGVRDEPDTTPMLTAVLADGKRLALPRTGRGEMHAVEVTASTALEPSQFGIPEPPAGLPVLEPAVVGVVIVPGLAFDRDGYRVGYGGGFYDRYLALLPVGTPTIGVCFAEQMVDRVPREPFDLPVTIVLSA